MNLKKTLLCLLLILSLCLCFVLVACDDEPDPTPEPPPVTDDGNSKKGEITKTEDANNSAQIPQPNENVGEGETNRYH